MIASDNFRLDLPKSDEPEFEVVTKTNVLLSELPLEFEQIQNAIFELEANIKLKEQEKTLQA